MVYYKPSSGDDRDFLEIVSENYLDSELIEYDPAPAPISQPDKPGDLGSYSCIFYSVQSIQNIILSDR